MKPRPIASMLRPENRDDSSTPGASSAPSKLRLRLLNTLLRKRFAEAYYSYNCANAHLGAAGYKPQPSAVSPAALKQSQVFDTGSSSGARRPAPGRAEQPSRLLAAGWAQPGSGGRERKRERMNGNTLG